MLFSFTSSADGSIILFVKNNIKKATPDWHRTQLNGLIKLTVL